MKKVLNKTDQIAIKEMDQMLCSTYLKTKEGKRRGGKKERDLLFPEVSKHSRKSKSSHRGMAQW
jgi:hypothetical protein